MGALAKFKGCEELRELSAKCGRCWVAAQRFPHFSERSEVLEG